MDKENTFCFLIKEEQLLTDKKEDSAGQLNSINSQYSLNPQHPNQSQIYRQGFLRKQQNLSSKSFNFLVKRKSTVQRAFLNNFQIQQKGQWDIESATWNLYQIEVATSYTVILATKLVVK